jgi:DNA-binding transcriptional regulator YiaG
MPAPKKPKAKSKAKAASEGIAPAVMVSEEPKATGRPSKFKEEYIEQARKLCELGLTDEELARYFEVHVATIYRWQASFPLFCEALKVGKAPADDRVERSLYHKAVGYTFDSEKIFNYQGEIVRAKSVEHVPPDTTAAIFWLKNRRKDEWRDRQELTGENGQPLFQPVINVTTSADPVSS